MFENLKIALRKQKKLIIIFFLTIFIPAILLSIFGIRAIRNERFRLAKQIENENRQAADFLKTQINNRFIELESTIQKLAQLRSFSERDYQAIIKMKSLSFLYSSPPLLKPYLFLPFS